MPSPVPYGLRRFCLGLFYFGLYVWGKNGLGGLSFSRPDHLIEDESLNGTIDLGLNTTEGAQSRKDSKSIRRRSLVQKIPYFTTLAACRAAVRAIRVMHEKPLSVRSLQKA